MVRASGNAAHLAVAFAGDLVMREEGAASGLEMARPVFVHGSASGPQLVNVSPGDSVASLGVSLSQTVSIEGQLLRAADVIPPFSQLQRCLHQRYASGRRAQARPKPKGRQRLRAFR